MNMVKGITIPKPCHQQWEQMIPVNDGRHCESCCKTVTDFTEMSTEAVIAALSSKGNLCGRFETGQLANINALLKRPLSSEISWRKLSIAAAFAGVFATFQAAAKIPEHALSHGSAKLNAIGDTIIHRKKAIVIECKSLTAKHIDLNTSATKPDTMSTRVHVNESVQTTLVGEIVIRGWRRYSFFHRLWQTINWPVRKIFGN